MENIKIVEYEDKYAKGLVEMWLKSNESWNGIIFKMTKDSIIRDHKNAYHLNVYLAVKNEEVIGYCSLDRFTMDDNTLYVDLLNVRTDYHGKKVGKALVLKSVEQTIHLGWPRLDLFTWPGNIKAVPLYKKCGFFWEKRDDSTHLMNFIPTVLKTEALNGFFSIIDWYADSKRLIEKKPDVNLTNGFNIFTYHWEKDNIMLKVEFEQTSRGICGIECNDYKIQAKISNHKLISGITNSISYIITNKTGKKLDVRIKGKNHKNIRFDMDKQVSVKTEETIRHNFLIQYITEEQDKRKTHPSVCADIIINGKKAEFKIGIEPQFPVSIELQPEQEECFLNKESNLAVLLQNNISEKIKIQIPFTNNENILFNQDLLEAELNPNEKTCLIITYRIKRFQLYKTKPVVKITYGNTDMEHPMEMTCNFQGQENQYGGKTKQGWIIVNGPYIAWLMKSGNRIRLRKICAREFHNFAWLFPIIGKPFSEELSKKSPEKVEISNKNGISTLKAIFNSHDFKDIIVSIIIKLYPDGKLIHYYEVTNNNNEIKDFYLNDRMNFGYINCYLPLNKDIFYTGNTLFESKQLWRTMPFTENWIFCKKQDITIGIHWHPDNNPEILQKFLVFKNRFTSLRAGETRTSHPVTVLIDGFQTWQLFRNHVMKTDKSENLKITEHISAEINQNNCFLTGHNIKIKLVERKNSFLHGQYSLESIQQSFLPVNFSIEKNKKLNSFDYTIEKKNINNIDIVILKHKTPSYCREKQYLVFFKQEKSIIQDKENGIDNKKILTSDNGLLKISASPDYAPGLFSAVCQNQEWLDHSYPNSIHKSWWYPWTGGIYAYFPEMNNVSLFSHKRSAKHFVCKDNFANTWTGLETNTDFTDHEIYNGLILCEYFLMLPHTPLLCYFAKIKQKNSRHFFSTNILSEIFLKPDNNIQNCWFKTWTEDTGILQIFAGDEINEINNKNLIKAGGKQKKELIIYAPSVSQTKLFAETYQQVHLAGIRNKIKIRQQNPAKTAPVYLIFTDLLDDHHLSNSRVFKTLDNICFKD